MFMYDTTNFHHFFSSNESSHPENEGFLVIIGLIFDCDKSALNTNVSGSFCSVVQGKAKNDSSASHIRKLVFYPGVV